MSFPTPDELRAQGEAQIRRTSLKSARACALRFLQRGSTRGDGVISMAFSSTHPTAVEMVADELEASGWIVIERTIRPRGWTHYLEVMKTEESARRRRSRKR